MSAEDIKELREVVSKEVRIIQELVSIYRSMDASSTGENSMLETQANSLSDVLRKKGEEIKDILEDLRIIKPLRVPEGDLEKTLRTEKPKKRILKKSNKKTPVQNHGDIEKTTLKRIKGKKKIVYKKEEKKPSKYVKFSNDVFGSYGNYLSKQDIFLTLKKDLVKANLRFIPKSYIAVMLMTTLLSFFVGLGVFIFLLFFNIGLELPIITLIEESLLARLAKIFWIPLVTPIITFIGMYVYPSLEKAYVENKINQELPFATIHMSAISASLLEPSKIFEIMVATKEYPHLEKEFIKLINEINVYGYDFVTAIRNVATNSASSRLSELFNGLAMTINSGGDLQTFFDKRAQSFLFEYRIEREKYTKTAETFMDIYISVVIAAPMILMLLMVMMSVSGLGFSIGPSAITLIMVLGVSMINVLFLVFLQLKQPSA